MFFFGVKLKKKRTNRTQYNDKTQKIPPTDTKFFGADNHFNDQFKKEQQIVKKRHKNYNN